MANYCTASDVMGYLQDDGLSISLINAILPGVARAIDTYCRRSFSTTLATRLYDWSDPFRLTLRDDLASLTQVVTNAGQTLLAVDFFLDPIDGPPFHSFHLSPTATLAGKQLQYYLTTERALQVTGLWGYQTSVPSDIKLGAIIWSADVYARSDMRALTGVKGGSMDVAIDKAIDKPPADALPHLNAHRRVLIRTPGRERVR